MDSTKDLFEQPDRPSSDYSAKDIEVLEGLEPVRRRPGMYIGGTDERALHHLAAEVLDNAMDEAVAGHASRIEFELDADGALTVRDNGRGIPVDKHAKFKDKSALEVILTTLHSGGKFNNKVYHTSGGLHGVGISVVNALAKDLTIEVARDKVLYRQSYSQGAPLNKLKKVGAAPNRRGTLVRFTPDPEIFGKGAAFAPARLYRMARSKAYLFRGVEIRWKCDAKKLKDDTPAEAVLHFPGGLEDFLNASLEERRCITPTPFAGRITLPDDRGRIEWAIAWPEYGESFLNSYCNTVPTPQGGTHEAGLRAAMTKGLKTYGEMTNNRRASTITPDDVMGGTCALLSIFIPDPEFQGQTKEKLANAEATRLVESALKDHFDHWLSGAPDAAGALLARVVERAEERLRRRQEREVNRKSATRKLR
ncbi:MAG: ATP-binding protein, partial [Minwuiales bacterium]|nr:ATP-binding protein [Minwuiales bacterium]